MRILISLLMILIATRAEAVYFGDLAPERSRVDVSFRELAPVEVAKVEYEKTALCGCDGNQLSACCLCKKEIDAGIRGKYCGCKSNLSSQHMMLDGKPVGSTGVYFRGINANYFEPVKPEELPADAKPTPHDEVRAILAELPIDSETEFIEYGSGVDARFCLAAASLYGVKKCIGIEIDPERALQSRRLIESLGLSDRIEIIHGDATTLDVQGDIGVAYLWEETLAALKPKIEKLEAFGSYRHEVPGLAMSKKGDSYYYSKPKPKPQKQQNFRGNLPVVYVNVKAKRGCHCYMCNSLRANGGYQGTQCIGGVCRKVWFQSTAYK